MARIETCGCQVCEGLARRFKGDPGLLAFYRRQLLIRGWAGVTDDLEAAYMLAHASWYASAVERGRETAARMGFGKRFGEIGEAWRPSGEEFALGGTEAGLLPYRGHRVIGRSKDGDRTTYGASRG